jgi:uncharacterized protein (TIGR02246 family)
LISGYRIINKKTRPFGVEIQMKQAFTLLFVILSFSVSAQSNRANTMSQNEADAIFLVTEQFLTAWNNGDSKAAAAFFTEDGTRVGAFGDVQHGRAEIEKAYERLMYQSMPGAKAKQEKGDVRMLGNDLAVWQGGLEIALPEGTVLKGHVMQVMKKVNGKWMILEVHPKLFPPPKK